MLLLALKPTCTQTSCVKWFIASNSINISVTTLSGGSALSLAGHHIKHKLAVMVSGKPDRDHVHDHQDGLTDSVHLRCQSFLQLMKGSTCLSTSDPGKQSAGSVKDCRTVVISRYSNKCQKIDSGLIFSILPYVTLRSMFTCGAYFVLL